MAIQKTEGILLRRQDLRETSLILTFYTRDFGKLKGIVRGVRGSRAQCGGGAFELFSLDEIVFYERKTGDIFNISQCDLMEFFDPIRRSLERTAYAAYISELLDSVTVLADKNSDVFDLLLDSLRLLSGEASAKRAARLFEIRLLGLLGLMPLLEVCAGCGRKIGPAARFSFRHGGMVCRDCLGRDPEARPILAGTVKFIQYVRAAPFDRAARIKVAGSVGKELEAILRKFLDSHIERRLKTVEFLKEIER